jgi:hypothetical protein
MCRMEVVDIIFRLILVVFNFIVWRVKGCTEPEWVPWRGRLLEFLWDKRGECIDNGINYRIRPRHTDGDLPAHQYGRHDRAIMDVASTRNLLVGSGHPRREPNSGRRLGDRKDRWMGRYLTSSDSASSADYTRCHPPAASCHCVRDGTS